MSTDKVTFQVSSTSGTGVGGDNLCFRALRRVKCELCPQSQSQPGSALLLKTLFEIISGRKPLREEPSPLGAENKPLLEFASYGILGITEGHSNYDVTS